MNGRVLVTGGFGYLGGRIVEALEAEGYDLRLSTRREAKDYPAWAGRLEVIQCDLSNREDLPGLTEGMDAVVHLAAMNEIDAGKDPLGAVQTNSLDSLKLLLAANDAGIKRFLYFSTAHVYGSPLEGRFDETMACRPIHPYAYSHRSVEDYVLSLHDQNRLEGVVIRLSNGFGAPRDAGVDRWTLLVNDLCRQAVTGRKLVLRSSGLQERDFIPLEDVARGTVHLLRLDKARLGNSIFNLGGGKSATIYDMASAIAARAEGLLGFKPPIERPEPGLHEEHGAVDFSIERIRETGFELVGSLEKEIDSTLRLCLEAFGEY
ncbi:MAG: NAD-dependent epimerase/dehydratase family protein [Longimicrobiales bacterium]